MDLDAEKLRRLLKYEPESGQFFWAEDANKPGRNLAGKRAGSRKGMRYRYIKIDYEAYAEHHLAWLYVYGRWPTKEVDHINLNKCDNRISNLREATRSQNAHNTAIVRTNTSGFKGVSRLNGRWRAAIRYGGKRAYLGTFPTPEMAAAAYASAAKRLFGEFARTTSGVK